jgi:hypothetical protein
MISRPVGRAGLTAARRGPARAAAVLGSAAGEELRRRGGPGFFDLPAADEKPM